MRPAPGISVLFIAVLAGCAGGERIYGGAYEGLKTREAVRNPTSEPGAASKLPSYQDYEAERKKLLEPGR